MAHVYNSRRLSGAVTRRLLIGALIFASCGFVAAQSKALQEHREAAKPDLSRYPAAELRSKLLKVRLYLPDASGGYYRGTRFDWSGLISRVEFNRHTFFSEFKSEHDPLNHDDICGTAEEFGMITLPPGFTDAKPGEAFVKIGIGILERPDDSAYTFWKRYKITQPGPWRIRRHPDNIRFSQSLRGPGGWAYEYTKTITLSPDTPTLTIIRQLKNTGAKTIETDHYGHNFLQIDDVPAGRDYVLDFLFRPRFTEDSRTQGLVELDGHSLVFTGQAPPEKAIWVRFEGFDGTIDNQITIRNRRTRGILRMATDRPLTRCVFYSSGGVLAPEPFVKFTIPPGEEREWKTSYSFQTE